MFLYMSLAVLLIVVTETYGQTPLAGVISTSTTLIEADSPYVAEDGVIVEDGATLTISAGVTVHFPPEQGLEVGKI